MANPLFSHPGEKSGRARLTEGAVRRIRKAVAGGVDQQTLAEAYNLHESTIYLIVRRKTWKHVT